jgi:hypothetical protein
MRAYTRLFEAKQVGVLYHFTSFGSLWSILENDELKVSSEWEGISFTRNKLLNKTSSWLKFRYPSVRMVIDGDRLSQNYKISPFNYSYRRPKWDDSAYNSERASSESEEIVRENIEGIKNYIIRIDLFERLLDDEIADNEEMNHNDVKEWIENQGIKTTLI